MDIQKTRQIYLDPYSLTFLGMFWHRFCRALDTQLCTPNSESSFSLLLKPKHSNLMHSENALRSLTKSNTVAKYVLYCNISSETVTNQTLL